MEETRRKLAVGDRFLSFVVDSESYGMEILKVKELMGMTVITPLPKTDKYIKGVINLRGQIIPIIDLRLKFGLEFREYTKRTSIIIVESEYEGEHMLMGIVVDAIQEVINIPSDKISRIPYINTRINAEYITGIADTPDGIKIILDIQKILTDDEINVIRQAVPAGSAKQKE